MREGLFVEERRRIILDQLRAEGRVSVKTLSELLQVSAVTIRQDLRALESDGLLERTYGGAVRQQKQLAEPELSFHLRLTRQRKEKEAIAAAAAALVEDGHSVALDASSTAYLVAAVLKQRRKLTVVTNSLVIAQVFLDNPKIHVILPGGRLRRDSVSVVGYPQGLPEINFNIGFFGARGVTVTEGITDIDADEVALKRALYARCVHAVIVVDGSKWMKVSPYTFVRLDEMQHVITSADAPGDLVERFRATGIRVDIADG